MSTAWTVWTLDRLMRSRYGHPDHLQQLVAAEPVHVDARPLDDALEQLAFVHQSVADPLLYPKPVAQSYGLGTPLCPAGVAW